MASSTPPLLWYLPIFGDFCLTTDSASWFSALTPFADTGRSFKPFSTILDCVILLPGLGFYSLKVVPGFGGEYHSGFPLPHSPSGYKRDVSKGWLCCLSCYLPALKHRPRENFMTHCATSALWPILMTPLSIHARMGLTKQPEILSSFGGLPSQCLLLFFFFSILIG